jgi:hypothetical protein
MSDKEYLAAFQYILLPVASSFNPDIVIVSAGLITLVISLIDRIRLCIRRPVGQNEGYP